MTSKENIYYTFYIIFFALAIVSGMALGFQGHTHTPPAPFLFEMIAIPTGIVLLIIDLVMRNPLKVHAIGLTANIAVAFFIYYIATA
jgi:hypothetical protein